jgi:hypothetical protein
MKATPGFSNTLKETGKALEQNSALVKVLLVCFSKAACEIYSLAIQEVIG